jgi:hypothetical protein
MSTSMAEALTSAGVRTSKTVRKPATRKAATSKKASAPKRMTTKQYHASIDKEIVSLLSFLGR